MNTITINPDIYSHAEQYAKMHNLSVGELIERTLRKALGLHTTEDSAQTGKKATSWLNYKVSKEVMAMTFNDRKELPEDYREAYVRAINENLQ